jgi:hypothetical protein
MMIFIFFASSWRTAVKYYLKTLSGLESLLISDVWLILKPDGVPVSSWTPLMN